MRERERENHFKTITLITLMIFAHMIALINPPADSDDPDITYNASGTLRSSYIAEEMRTTVMNIYRVPLNVLVIGVITLNHTNNPDTTTLITHHHTPPDNPNNPPIFTSYLSQDSSIITFPDIPDNPINPIYTFRQVLARGDSLGIAQQWYICLFMLCLSAASFYWLKIQIEGKSLYGGKGHEYGDLNDDDIELEGGRLLNSSGVGSENGGSLNRTGGGYSNNHDDDDDDDILDIDSAIADLKQLEVQTEQVNIPTITSTTTNDVNNNEIDIHHLNNAGSAEATSEGSESIPADVSTLDSEGLETAGLSGTDSNENETNNEKELSELEQLDKIAAELDISDDLDKDE